MYKLYPGGGVINKETGAFIPENETNRDWASFQAWLAEGNKAEPWKNDDELLTEARNEALKRIDDQAEIERQKVITPGAGQAMTYLRKEQEARNALLQASPSPASFPILQASVAAEIGITLNDVSPQHLLSIAETVVFHADQWASIAAHIEEVRLGAKRRVALAETPEEIASIIQGLSWQ